MLFLCIPLPLFIRLGTSFCSNIIIIPIWCIVLSKDCCSDVPHPTTSILCIVTLSFSHQEVESIPSSPQLWAGPVTLWPVEYGGSNTGEVPGIVIYWPSSFWSCLFEHLLSGCFLSQTSLHVVRSPGHVESHMWVLWVTASAVFLTSIQHQLPAS